MLNICRVFFIDCKVKEKRVMKQYKVMIVVLIVICIIVVVVVLVMRKDFCEVYI